MKNTLLAATSAICLPMAAAAEFDFNTEVHLGFGSGDGTVVDGGFAEIKTDASTSFALGNGSTVSVKAGVAWRSFQNDLESYSTARIDDDNFDLELGFDLGNAGKLTFTSYNESGVPWATGEVRNRGSVPVWAAVPPLLRGIKDADYAFTDGTFQRDFAFIYDVELGKVEVHIEADPLGYFNGVKKGDLTPTGIDEEPASFLAEISVPTDIAKFTAAVNDLGDYKLSATKVFGPGTFILIADHQGQSDTGLKRNSVVAIHNARDAGIYKGFFALYAKDNSGSVADFGGRGDREGFVFSTNWGGEKWDLQVATDIDKNLALNAKYAIMDNIDLHVGYDTGFDNPGFIGEGFDLGLEPSPSAAARDENLEIGLTMRF